MDRIFSTPKEGDIYKKITVGGHYFELRFGFYADFERESGEPVVIYPDLTDRKLYSESGDMLVTAVQEPCPHYCVSGDGIHNECCSDCEYYMYSGDDIGICSCPENNRNYQERKSK